MQFSFPQKKSIFLCHTIFHYKMFTILVILHVLLHELIDNKVQIILKKWNTFPSTKPRSICNIYYETDFSEIHYCKTNNCVPKYIIDFGRRTNKYNGLWLKIFNLSKTIECLVANIIWTLMKKNRQYPINCN